MMMKRVILGLLTVWTLGFGAGQAAERSNLLLILADDCTHWDMEVYGGQAKTPHLNRLAAEGMKFTRCFQAAPMCSPTRHCLYTGLYPVKSGAYPNHTMAHEWVRSIASHLKEAGYGAHLSGKRHIQPESVFPFELSGNNNPDVEAFGRVLEREEPFLFIAASNEPHEPWDCGDAGAYPAQSLKLPPVMADTKETREAYSRYLAEITYFDGQVGELLARLEASGRSRETLVMVLSEQGNSFPFAKWTCYEAGVGSGCVARWPGRVKGGTVSEALVEYVDVVPTFLEAAGMALPEGLDGRSFLPVLTGAAEAHKSEVYALQTTRGIINGSEHYGIRSVRDKRYRYIWNLTPEAVFQNAATRNEVFESWKRKADAGDEAAGRLVRDYQHRPAEELYDCEADPWNRNNLAGDASLAAEKNRLRGLLEAWMEAQGDEGQATELRALERMPKGGKDGQAGKSKAKKRRGKGSD